MTPISTDRPNPLAAWAARTNTSIMAAHRTMEERGLALSYERVRLMSLPLDHPSYVAPSWPAMAAVYALTEGEVAPNDWAPLAMFPAIDRRG